MNTLQKLLSKPLPSTRSGAFYNTFPYPTKISPEAIAVYLATITQPGDTILDAFGGSGSTGIAALLCEHPTAQMIKIAEELGVNPTWGKRNAVIYEIGSYGSFAARTLSSRLSASTFRKSVDEFVQLAENELGALYAAKDCDGNPGLIRHIIWSEVLICPTCKEEISYFQHGTKRSPVRFQDKIKCPHCGREHPTDSFDSATECYFDKLLGREILRKKRIPVWVYGVTGSNKWDRAATNEDIELLAQIEEKPYADHDKSKEIFWGELHRSGYHLGITHLHHFYAISLTEMYGFLSYLDESERASFLSWDTMRSDSYVGKVMPFYNSGQLSLLLDLERYRKVYFSAPTSFGKTSLLLEFIIHNYLNLTNALIIVPTNSLLEELYMKLIEINKLFAMGYEVSTQPYLKNESRNFLIITPERFC